ncbi:DUF3052 domain-containing protein [Boudabousia marimammalium]|uniref:DUF3052 domain-containing protein n=1 Tax=Boudabousia marimammalium TaxID=156892 RepID=A0A1Q5PNW2_9ACTO|nr:DUF3052 domain-containing protein [Boudabousia marimammalium]OKL49207.1 hypothetical protein BM477_04230 [Boudabousia marimammalium]
MSADNARAHFGFAKGAVVQEFYVDDDAETTLRDLIEQETGEELVDEDYDDVVDGALIWWRSEDGEVEDLTDLLVDAAGNLDNGGLIWVLTPKAGEDLYVEPFIIAEAAKVAGLSTTSTASLGKRWAGTRLMSRPRK